MASSSAVLLRLICRKGFAGGSSKVSWNRTAGSCSFRFNNGRRQMMSTMTKLQNPSSSSSPWLMLPPATESSYNFYSLADNKVITLSNHEKELMGFTHNVKKLKCRGSSRGWLALLSPHNLDLFLFNPISRRHIKLPPINKLPNFPDDKSSSRDVDKVILSCSPDDENCRAVLIHNCNNLLASCCPGRSNEWTPFGGRYWRDEVSGKNFARGYHDCAYSSAQKVLFGLTQDGDLETWDLGIPSSPRLINKVKSKRITSYSIASLRVKYFVGQREHLVVSDEPDLLLRVTQYVMSSVAPDGSYIPKFDERAENCPHMTIDFDIHKYDPEEGDFKYVHVSSLGGLALFVGNHNQCVAFPAATDDQHYPELKPNSIYFTEPYYRGALKDDYGDEQPFDGTDIGIFNYEDKTVSPCYYPCDVQSLKRIVPPPVWFFPSRFI